MSALVKALLVLLVVVVLAVGGYLAIIGTSGERGLKDLGKLGGEVVGGEVAGGKREGFITTRQFRSIELGTSDRAVRKELGEPAKPPDLEKKPDVDSEPRNTSCIYYAERAEAGESRKLFRFCFRGERLHSKDAD